MLSPRFQNLICSPPKRRPVHLFADFDFLAFAQKHSRAAISLTLLAASAGTPPYPMISWRRIKRGAAWNERSAELQLCANIKTIAAELELRAPPAQPRGSPDLLLPGSLLMAIGAQLLAPFMLIDFGFPTFL